jgi:predicted phage tail protein
MTNIIIHGEMGEVFGNFHKFEITKLLDVAKALNANNRGFKRYSLDKFKEGINYVYIDPKNPNKRWKTSEELINEEAPEEVHVVPQICGSGFVAAVVAAVSFVTTAVATAVVAAGAWLAAGSALANLAIGLIIQGVMALLFPVELPDVATQTSESKIDQSSYLFSNLKNSLTQGFPVPLLYGELRIGSSVVSTNIVSEDLG